VVALTAHAMRGEEARAREAGFDAFLTKPVDTQAFRETLRRFLGDVRGLRQDDPTTLVFEEGGNQLEVHGVVFHNQNTRRHDRVFLSNH